MHRELQACRLPCILGEQLHLSVPGSRMHSISLQVQDFLLPMHRMSSASQIEPVPIPCAFLQSTYMLQVQHRTARFLEFREPS